MRHLLGGRRPHLRDESRWLGPASRAAFPGGPRGGRIALARRSTARHHECPYGGFVRDLESLDERHGRTKARRRRGEPAASMVARRPADRVRPRGTSHRLRRRGRRRDGRERSAPPRRSQEHNGREWSPDEKQIAFADDCGTITTASVGGGLAKVVAREAYERTSAGRRTVRISLSSASKIIAAPVSSETLPEHRLSAREFSSFRQRAGSHGRSDESPRPVPRPSGFPARRPARQRFLISRIVRPHRHDALIPLFRRAR